MGTAPLPTENGGNLPDLLDMDAVCRFWGGTAPVNPATIYRAIKRGEHPAPIKFGPLSRFVTAELLAERERRMAARFGEAA